jgi:valyl-tRNA synthetase
MAKLDEEIDQLYQLPLEEFTAARNALAKESGDSAVKKLEKPVLSAWAVNQLFWHERKLFDEVIKTSGQVRTAHQQMLGGKASDVKAAEVFHGEAMRKAKDAIRKILEAAGTVASDAVMTPVTEMLDALPTTDQPGRFTKPFRRTGFEALHGVTISAKSSFAKATEPKPAKATSTAAADEDGEKARLMREELAMAKERLRFADAAQREAEAALERAQRALERAERARERVEKELEEAAAAEKAAAKEVSASESALQKATAEREKLAKKINA